MPIVAAGIPIYYVGAAAFTSLAAAYAYINREGLSESISDAYNYYTGNDELTTLEDLGIKVDNTSKEYKTYEYAFPSNSSTDKDLTLTQIKDIKSVIGTIHFKHFFPKKSIVEVNSVSHAALELVKTMQRQMIDNKKKVETFLA